MDQKNVQIAVFFGLTALIGLLTWLQCRRPRSHSGDANRDYFLAGGSLNWVFIAGSITLTNLSTDQLVGMNGNQMALLAWWEISAVAGLVILAFVFLPVYYRNQCVTTTELLQKKYGDNALRTLVALLFLLGGLFIYLPIMLYTGALFIKTMFGLETPLLLIAAAFALVGSAYAVFGGLRAVVVSDTYSGVGVLGLCLLVVWLSLKAVDFDLSGIPAERLTMIGGDASPIPWHTLFTGMVFIQIFYWSFNQTITQRAMAAPSLREAQKGVLAAAAIRILIVPAIVVLPGIVSYKLYGELGDAAYGRMVGAVLPAWLSGAFAAMMTAAVLTSFNSALNSAAALYVVDVHERFFKPNPNVRGLATGVTIGAVALSLLLVPMYQQAKSIINLVQQLNGLLSMPILSAFLVGLLFKNISGRAAILGVVTGIAFYGGLTAASAAGLVEGLPHYIHQMFATLILSVGVILASNRLLWRKPEGA